MGRQQLPAHRIWEVSTHSMAVLDGAADPLCLPCQGGPTSSPAQQDIPCLPGTPWHVLLCLCHCCLSRQRTMLMGDNTWRRVLSGTKGHQVCLGTEGQGELCGMDGRGELTREDGGHGWRVRGWERKCGGGERVSLGP